LIRAHKIRLDPNDKQATGFAKAAGCARFAWNYALNEWQRQYAAGEKPSEISLRKQLNAVKREQYPWMLDSTKTAPQQAIKNLGVAFKNFFEKRAKYPRFKKKGIRDSFRADNGPGTFETDGKKIRLPKIGWIRMREALRFEGRLLAATVSRRAQRWYVSIQVEVEDKPIVRKNHGTVGVDLGISHLATLSTGEHIEGLKPLKAALVRLRRLNKLLSRKKKGSQNRQKAKMKLARQHARIADIRNDALHKLTTDLVRRFDVIVIEDLNVRGMMKNRHLSRAISDMGFFEFRRQLGYKGPLFGSEIVVYPRFKPSSKECADCGYVVEKMPLSIREWDCPSCGVVHDRDVNAAKVLENWAASSAVSACGEERSGAQICKCVKRSSVKQEINTGQGMSLFGSV
jgi:putative transposase